MLIQILFMYLNMNYIIIYVMHSISFQAGALGLGSTKFKSDHLVSRMKSFFQVSLIFSCWIFGEEPVFITLNE